MSLLLVIPFTEAELSRTLDNLRWCEHLDGRQEYTCVLAAEDGFDIQSVIDAAKRCFTSVFRFRYDKWSGDKRWPHPQNYAWQTVARYIESAAIDHNEKYEWFWWEQDAIPLKQGWLRILEAAHTNGQRPFSGPVTWQNGHHYVAGVAIYPHNVSRHLPTALLAQGQPWDKAAALRDSMLTKTHDLSALIYHTPDVNNTPFTTKAEVDELPESAVLFHKNKDGSLLAVLEGRSVGGFTSVLEPPSFTQQTEWPSGLFTFPAATDKPTIYFNPSILDVNGKRWLFTRRQRFNTSPGIISSSINDLCIWEIRTNMTLAPTPIIPRPPGRHKDEQWEDPRAYLGSDGHVYASFATWIHHKQEWFIRQAFCRLSKDWRSFEVVSEPHFGGNHSTPLKATRHEKNWVWFEHENEWQFIYSIAPYHSLGRNSVFQLTTNQMPNELPWKHGEPRGGTPPIRIGNEYLSFFHSATEWRKPKRRYHMGAYCFQADPPFAVTRMTPEPLLTGSIEDFRVWGGPLVIFPNGAVKDGDSWLVVFGVNDEGCGWIKIPHSALEERMVAV